jgi:hypothetical protein
MSQQNENTDVTRLKNGKVTNNDSMSKRSVAAIFPNKDAADAVVNKLTEVDFANTEIQFATAEMSDKGDYLVIVHAGERAIIALEILVNAGGDTNTNQPEQLAKQAEDARALPRQNAADDDIVIAPEVLPDGKIRL